MKNVREVFKKLKSERIFTGITTVVVGVALLYLLSFCYSYRVRMEAIDVKIFDSFIFRSVHKITRTFGPGEMKMISGEEYNLVYVNRNGGWPLRLITDGKTITVFNYYDNVSFLIKGRRCAGWTVK